MSIFVEEKLLKKLFHLDGDLLTGGPSNFDFKTQDSPGYVIVKLKGNTAELYSRPHRKFDDVLERIKQLSEDDIDVLKKEGYVWE